MNPAFWGGRRVLVTGHTGFKGSWLCLLLHRMGARLTGYALPPPSAPSLYGLAGVESVIESHTADLRDPAAVSAIVQAAEPEVVLHLGAQALVRPSYVDPVGTFATNVLGTVHVLEAARRTPSVRAVVHVSSDKCYDNREWLWGYREIDALGGHDPYSASKAAAELAVGAYARSFAEGPAIGSGRAGNVIGGGDFATDRLLPDCARAFAAGEAVVVRNPRAVRPWQHVLEPLAGYLVLAERLWQKPRPPAGSGAWAYNFGPAASDVHPVSEVVERSVALWGGGARWLQDGRSQPHEAQELRLDSSRARHELGWQPRTDFATALAWTLEWYRDWARGADARAACERDLERFLARPVRS